MKKSRDELSSIALYDPVDKGIKKLDGFIECSTDEVKKVMLSLPTKSCELDYIPTKILKDHIDALAPLVCSVVNLSLKTGHFPLKWKEALITPLLKKPGLKLIPKNYRPVSNLSHLSKVLEKCMLKRFMSHCTDENLIPVHQSAYIPHRSCETSLLKVANDILWAFERKESVALVALDLSAAFDTVDHSVLLTILERQFGLTDTVLWIKNYLAPRSFIIKINNAKSDSKQPKVSVPQGSVAGPTLYWAYASPLKDVA